MPLSRPLRMGADAQRCCGKSAIPFRSGADAATLAPGHLSCDLFGQGREMKRLRIALLVSAASVSAVFSVAATYGHGTSIITIRHQMKGCHTWSYDGEPYRASLRVVLGQARFVRFVNNDMMPQRLVQLSGPRVAVNGASMNRIGAKAQVLFGEKGVYRFRTVAGKEFAWAPRDAAGPDHVLRLTVVVK